MRIKQSWQSFWKNNWRPIAIYGSLFAFLGTLLFSRLGSLLPGYSANEAAAYSASTSLQGIFDNPLNAPFSLVVHGLSFLSEHSYLLARLSAVGFGLCALIVFCWLVQRWYGTRTAVIGTLLFGSSAWFLHVARLGTPDVLLFALLALVGVAVWLKRSNNAFVLLLCLLIAAASLYVPGMIWIVLPVAIWEWKRVDYLFSRHVIATGVGALLFLAILAPLVWAFYRTPSLMKEWAGLPAEGWPNLLESLQRFAELPLALFARAPANAETWLGNVPVLDAFAAAMFILGVYLFIKYMRLSRVRLFVPVLFIGWVLASLGGSVTLTAVIPFIYIVIAAGVGYMFDSWLNIFPKNPIAKTIGLCLITVAILASMSFQMRHYFVAWPNNPDTRAVFNLREPSDTIEQ